MIMDEVMYGITPSARILIRSMAPPENMLNRPRKVPWFWLNNACSCAGLMPGTGMWVPIRYTTTAISTNISLALSSARPSALAGVFGLAIDLSAGCFDGSTRTLGHANSVDGVGLGDIARQHDLGALDVAINDVRLLQRSDVHHVTFNLRQLCST